MNTKKIINYLVILALAAIVSLASCSYDAVPCPNFAQNNEQLRKQDMKQKQDQLQTRALPEKLIARP